MIEERKALKKMFEEYNSISDDKEMEEDNFTSDDKEMEEDNFTSDDEKNVVVLKMEADD